MFGKEKKKKTDILEDKAEFANNIMEIWKSQNYANIKIAHNEIVTYLKEQNFDFFSMQYLLTITYMELLVNEYLASHKEEIQKQFREFLGSENK